jgi:hypothetical protein
MRLCQAGALLGIAQAVAARVDTIEHCSFAGPDRRYGPDFDPAVVEEIAAAGPALQAGTATALAAPAGPSPR